MSRIKNKGLPKKTKKTLDETLRYLLASVLYLEVPLVAVRFEFNGETWEADTPDEAIALRAKLEYSTRFPPDPHKQIDEELRFWTPDRFTSVVDTIGNLQHRLLMLIWGQPGISSWELMQKLGLESEVALAGVISGLAKQLRQLGIEPKQVFIIDVRWKKKGKARTFILNDFFRGVGSELRWPQAVTRKSQGNNDLR